MPQISRLCPVGGLTFQPLFMAGLRPRSTSGVWSSGALLLALWLLVAAAPAQTRQPGLGVRSANSWMLTPTDVSATSPVSAEVKRQRDIFFDQLAGMIGITAPLTPESAAPFGAVSDTVRLGGRPEIPQVPNRSIVIARFVESRSVLSQSGKAVYTEITFHATDVYQDASGRISPDSNLIVGFLGGTVRTGAGTVISLLTNPRKYFLQPNRTYLLVLEYQAEQELYINVGDWDISSGVLVADSSADRRLELRGGSRLLGLTKQQLSSYLSDYLRARQ